MKIPDGDLFMMCTVLDRAALRALQKGIHVRHLREDELALWKAIHFDDPSDAEKYDGFMTAYFDIVYAPHGNLFFSNAL